MGWFALSPLWNTTLGNTTAAGAYGDDTRKVLVIYSDGTAQLSGSSRTPATILSRALGICALLKQKPNVQVFVVWNNSNPSADPRIKDCASTPSHAYDMGDIGLLAAFRDVGLRLTTLRLAN